MIDKTISHYIILEKIGEGGMGVVYKAQDLKLQRLVALKFLPSNLLGDEEAKARFLREARAAAALQHPNICTIHEIDEADGYTFIVMAYLEGEELRKHIEKGPLSLERLLDIAIQVARGLQEAHGKGVVHRDIKPANIMDTTTGQAVLMDFGLAQIASAASKLTREGTTVGTSAYMSPEQTSGEKTDHRTDIWALGVVLYEMATGQTPFQGHYEQAILYSILHEAPEPITALRTGIPPELERIANKCLAKRADERYQTVSDLLADLGALKRSRESSEGKRQSSGTRDARPSIAVLPFENRSRDEDDEYFSDGVTEDIISALGKVEGLRVTPRASAFRFKGENTAVRQVAEKLNVGCVLTGTIRRAGSRLRITVELIDAAEDTQMWSERYDRVLEDIFDIQDEISQAIVNQLKRKLVGAVASPGATRRTADFEAYRLYLQGRHNVVKLSESGIRQGLSCFERALATDSNYPEPHAGLADAYALLGILGYARPADVMVKAKEEAVRALEMDETTADAHASLGVVRHWYDWDFAGAEQSYRRAAELNPADPIPRVYLGVLLGETGRPAEGVAELRAAVQLDPLSPFVNRILCSLLVYARDFEAALEQGRKTLDIDPTYFSVRWEMATAWYFLGRPDEALRTMEAAVSLAPKDPITLGFLGMCQAVAGRQEEALRTIDKLKDLRAERYCAASPIAWVYTQLGDFNQGFQWLDTAFEERDGLLVILKQSPWASESFRQDPRYQELLRRIGFPE